MTMRSPVRIIEARTGEIRWNWNYVENAHISHLYDRGEVDLRMLSKRKAAEVVEYMAAHESINKAANACITLTDEEIELLTNYAELSGDEASYLRVLCFMLKEGLYDNCVLWLPMTRNLRAGINDTDTEVYDRSPFGNHGTIYGAVWQTLPSGKSALSFDGVDDYVNCGNPSSLQLDGEWSVSAWFLVRSLPHNSGVIEKNWVHDKSFAMWIHQTDKFLAFDVFRSDGTRVDAHTSNNLISFDTWYHAVAVYDGTDIKLYVSGNLEATSSPGEIGKLDVGNLVIGYALPHEDLHGLIDEVRIYSRALSEEEIRRLYYLEKPFFI